MKRRLEELLKDPLLFALQLFQTASLLPLPYILTVSGSHAILLQKGLFSFLFELGFASIPILESLFLSFLYHLLRNEILLYFILPGIALLTGLLYRRIRSYLKYFFIADFVLSLAMFLFFRPFSLIAHLLALIWKGLEVCLCIKKS